jgi:hypothetical protein
MVLKTLVSSAFNHLSQVAARVLLHLDAVKASNHRSHSNLWPSYANYQISQKKRKTVHVQIVSQIFNPCGKS